MPKTGLPLLLTLLACATLAFAGQPNIIVFMADDLGYGDLSCYNPKGKIKTPNLDRLAGEGMRFTDAHTNAAQCSPTRYGLMTGRYSWRTRLKSAVLPHFATPLINEGRTTMASLLKSAGYATAGIGKWHLGLGWQARDGETFDPDSWAAKQIDVIDFRKPLTVSPLDFGFDYYFGINASNNMLPYCYIENDRAVRVPDKRKFPAYDSEDENGLVSSDYVSEEIDEVLYTKARAWLENHRRDNPKQPFFIYYPSSAIHRPCLARGPFRKTTGAGLRGDKVVELDDIIGRLMRDLERLGCAHETLFIFTSDNGPRAGDPEAFLKEMAAEEWGGEWKTGELVSHPNAMPYSVGGRDLWYTYGHSAAGPLRGFKGDVYEGGHRVPFIVRWPGVVKAGAVADELICHTDVLATLAGIAGVPLANDAAEDSISFLPALKGDTAKSPLRETLILDSWYGVKAIRQGPWKLIEGPGSGGWGTVVEPAGGVQLYNLKDDPFEMHNIAGKHPGIVDRLSALLKRYQADGRSVTRRN